MGIFSENTTAMVQLINNRLAEITLRRHPDSLYEPIHYTLAGGGKRLRAILVLLCTELCEGDIQKCLDVSVAIELLHNFTLVHDDIMDRDDLRRGRPTVHVKWDESTAILAGDGLVALAFQNLLNAPAEQIRRIGQVFSEAVVRVCEGQALDKEFETRSDITLDAYFDMIDKKTGELFSISCEMGALVANALPMQVTTLRTFGSILGRTFQLQDDLLDITVDESILGKPFASDVISHKKTFLVLYALENGSESDRQRLSQLYAKDKLDLNDVKEVQRIFYESGAIAHLSLVIHSEIQRALECLKDFPAVRAREILVELVQEIENRQY